MIEMRANLWVLADDMPEAALAVTTNGIVRRDGCLVMGKGIALQFAQRYPDLPLLLAGHVKQHGNTPCFVDYPSGPTVVSLPTKNHWRDPSPVELILRSVRAIAESMPHADKTCVIATRPGCGNGGLDWGATVRPALLQLESDLDRELPFIFVH